MVPKDHSKHDFTMKPLLFTSIFSSVLGMFQYGFNVASVNPPMKDISKFIRLSVYDHYDVQLSEESAEFIFSLTLMVFNVCGMVGALMAGWLANLYGRKVMLQVAAVISMLGSFALGACKAACSVELFVVGRVLVGYTSGLYTVLVPLVLNEVSPKAIRGTLGTLSQLSISLGIFTQSHLRPGRSFGRIRQMANIDHVWIIAGSHSVDPPNPQSGISVLFDRQQKGCRGRKVCLAATDVWLKRGRRQGCVNHRKGE